MYQRTTAISSMTCTATVTSCVNHTSVCIACAQLAYKFGELVEVHAADTYAEFVEANEVGHCHNYYVLRWTMIRHSLCRCLYHWFSH